MKRFLAVAKRKAPNRLRDDKLLTEPELTPAKTKQEEIRSENLMDPALRAALESLTPEDPEYAQLRHQLFQELRVKRTDCLFAPDDRLVLKQRPRVLVNGIEQINHPLQEDDIRIVLFIGTFEEAQLLSPKVAIATQDRNYWRTALGYALKYENQPQGGYPWEPFEFEPKQLTEAKYKKI